jgi:hypothetical protein
VRSFFLKHRAYVSSSFRRGFAKRSSRRAERVVIPPNRDSWALAHTLASICGHTHNTIRQPWFYAPSG